MTEREVPNAASLLFALDYFKVRNTRVARRCGENTNKPPKKRQPLTETGGLVKDLPPSVSCTRKCPTSLYSSSLEGTVHSLRFTLKFHILLSSWCHRFLETVAAPRKQRVFLTCRSMLHAERHQRKNVGESGAKIGHVDYQYGFGGQGSLAAIGGYGPAPKVNSRAFSSTPYTTRPPFAVDDEKNAPGGILNPYGRMTYWGLTKPGEIPAAGARRGAESSNMTVAGGGGGLGLGDAGAGALTTHPPTSSKLVSSDLSLLPGPAPGVYRNKPPLLFHSKPSGPLLASPMMPVMAPSSVMNMNVSSQNLPPLNTTDVSRSQRAGSAGGGGSYRSSSSQVVLTPRPASMPNNAQTFNIFYSDGSNEHDQELRLKIENHVRAVELQKANEEAMLRRVQEKKEEIERMKQADREAEERAAREHEIIKQRQLQEVQRENSVPEKYATKVDITVPPEPILVKKKTPKEDVVEPIKKPEDSGAPARWWLSQPEPVVMKKTPPPSSRSGSSLLANFQGPQFDLKPIPLDFSGRPTCQGAPMPPAPARVSQVSSPAPVLRTSMPKGGTSPSSFENVQLHSMLQRITRDQERIADLLERQTSMLGRQGLSPRGYGSSSPTGPSGVGEPLGSGRRPAPLGAGTYLTEGLRMPAGHTGLSSLLSAGKPNHEAGASKQVGTTSLSVSPLKQHNATIANTFSSDPIKTPIFSAGAKTAVGDSSFPLAPLQPLLPFSSNGVAAGLPPSSLPPAAPPISSFSASTKMVGPKASGTRFDNSVKLGASLSNNLSASVLHPVGDPDDLSVEPPLFRHNDLSVNLHKPQPSDSIGNLRISMGKKMMTRMRMEYRPLKSEWYLLT
eukprot:gene10043-7018_t